MKNGEISLSFKIIFLTLAFISSGVLFCKEKNVSNNINSDSVKFKYKTTKSIIELLRNDDYDKLALLLNNTVEYYVYGDEKICYLNNKVNDFSRSELKKYLFDSAWLQKYLEQKDIYSFRDAVKSENFKLDESYDGSGVEINGKNYLHRHITIQYKGFSYHIELYCKSDSECFIYRFGISP